MSNNDYIVEAVKGEPNSLTSIAFHTGVVLERERIIKLIIEAGYGLPDLITLIKGDDK